MKEKLIKNPDGSDGRIFLLDIEEVKTLCRPGEGADTCIWLVVGGKGFECLYYNRRAVSLTGEILEDRWRKGLTVAKRDGCKDGKMREIKITRRFWLSISGCLFVGASILMFNSWWGLLFVIPGLIFLVLGLICISGPGRPGGTED